MERTVTDMKKDRLRYTKNKTSANLAYVSILFDVLYFVSLYSSNVNYYYTITIGLSVVCNLLFLLVAFLSSEGVKSYKVSYSYALIGLSVLQIARIFGIPARAHEALTIVNGAEAAVMGDGQFAYITFCLAASAVAAVAAGVIGIYKATTLKNYEKEHGLA